MGKSVARTRRSCAYVLCLLSISAPVQSADFGLVGHWTIRGDCRDHSGHGLDGINHGVDLKTSTFDGVGAYIEVPNADTLHFGENDLTISAEIFTNHGIDDCFGDIIAKFSGAERKGVNFSLVSNSSGYNSQPDSRQLFFGVDDARLGTWVDCGRPGGKTNSTDALTVFDDGLYVGTVDAAEEADWAHVFRYRGGRDWEDCGRLGRNRVRGVYAMTVHNGALYAGTAGSHGGRNVNVPEEGFGRVYRYRGGQDWEDIGQPGDHFRISSLASYQGKLYALSINTFGPTGGGVFVYDGGREWRQCGDFGRPASSGVHNGRLYAGFPQGKTYLFSGDHWDDLGNPLGSLKKCDQLHSHGIFGDELYVGTWPLGTVAVRRQDQWQDVGRLGDAFEIVALAAYNGSFYGGSIPRAEVFRFDGPNRWTSIGRLFDPPGYSPVPVGSIVQGTQDWTRASSLAVYRGKLFSTTATCYRAQIDPPPGAEDVRGKVFCVQAGAAVSLDRDLGPGWKHVAAIRSGKNLRLFVDGVLQATAESESPEVNATCNAPLLIGRGQQAYFHGKIRELRIYNRSLSADEIKVLASRFPRAEADNVDAKN